MLKSRPEAHTILSASRFVIMTLFHPFRFCSNISVETAIAKE
jgi:hypothetical protein